MQSSFPIVESKNSISTALEVVDRFAKGICLVLEKGKLVGIATDGDLRRALLGGLSLQEKVGLAMNESFVACPITADEKEIRSMFSEKVRLIPLLDQSGKLAGLADPSGNYRIPILEPDLNGNEIHYLQDCISSNWISSQGKYVKEFEDTFSRMHSGMSALAVSSGTTALHLALVTLGIGKGDEVIVPNITFAATANAVFHCNAEPVLCEIDPSTWCIDPQEVECLIGPNTKAIIPVHLFGQACNMNELLEICRRHELLMIEDCAEGLGSKWYGQPLGTFGNASTFSFFGNKTISTGEGGMVLFGNEDDASKARVLRDHGMDSNRKYWHDYIGFNYRMTNIQAAIGVAQIEKFDSIIRKKLAILETYDQELIPCKHVAQTPTLEDGIVHSNWLYTVRLDKRVDRDVIIDAMLNKGIDARPVFNPLHIMPPYKNSRKSVNLSKSKDFATQGISLPSSVNLKDAEVREIAWIFKEILKDNDNC